MNSAIFPGVLEFVVVVAAGNLNRVNLPLKARLGQWLFNVSLDCIVVLDIERIFKLLQQKEYSFLTAKEFSFSVRN